MGVRMKPTKWGAFLGKGRLLGRKENRSAQTLVVFSVHRPLHLLHTSIPLSPFLSWMTFFLSLCAFLSVSLLYMLFILLVLPALLAVAPGTEPLKSFCGAFP